MRESMNSYMETRVPCYSSQQHFYLSLPGHVVMVVVQLYFLVSFYSYLYYL